jgi:serine/threonine protein kinase
MGQGLRLMHVHNYVHRDVSLGNIISYKDCCKIADLEYAKEVGTGSGHKERTVCLSSHDTDTLP